MDIRNYI